jgi:NAD(P)H dehydrogenase (quinone)
MKILVTGGTGQFGAATINFLLKKMPADNLVALVRDEDKATELKAKGVAIRIANYANYASLVVALKRYY